MDRLVRGPPGQQRRGGNRHRGPGRRSGRPARAADQGARPRAVPDLGPPPRPRLTTTPATRPGNTRRRSCTRPSCGNSPRTTSDRHTRTQKRNTGPARRAGPGAPGAARGRRPRPAGRSATTIPAWTQASGRPSTNSPARRHCRRWPARRQMTATPPRDSKRWTIATDHGEAAGGLTLRAWRGGGSALLP